MIALLERLALKLVIALAAALMLALLVGDRNRWKSRAGQYAAHLAAERGAHAATVAGYRAAAERARSADLANARRVQSRQAQISERTSDDYESRIAAARARYGRLRGQAGAGADTGGGRAAPVPAISASAQGVAQGAGEDRLPQSDRMIATEQAIQLDELIKWVKAQAAVESNGSAD